MEALRDDAGDEDAFVFTEAPEPEADALDITALSRLMACTLEGRARRVWAARAAMAGMRGAM